MAIVPWYHATPILSCHRGLIQGCCHPQGLERQRIRKSGSSIVAGPANSSWPEMDQCLAWRPSRVSPASVHDNSWRARPEAKKVLVQEVVLHRSLLIVPLFIPRRVPLTLVWRPCTQQPTAIWAQRLPRGRRTVSKPKSRNLSEQRVGSLITLNNREKGAASNLARQQGD